MTIQFNADPRSRYWSWRRQHPEGPEVEVWEAAWRAGGADMLHQSAQLARELGQVHALLERTERLIHWLARDRENYDIDAETEAIDGDQVL